MKQITIVCSLDGLSSWTDKSQYNVFSNENNATQVTITYPVEYTDWVKSFDIFVGHDKTGNTVPAILSRTTGNTLTVILDSQYMKKGYIHIQPIATKAVVGQGVDDTVKWKIVDQIPVKTSLDITESTTVVSPALATVLQGNIDAITDLYTVTSPVAGQTLIHDGTDFKNGTLDSTQVAYGDGTVSEALDGRYTDGEVDTLLGNKVDKVTGKSLVDDSDITYLSGVASDSIVRSFDKTKIDALGFKSINILGDSISWGANCADANLDSYAAILRRAINIEVGSKNYGYVPLVAQVTTEYRISYLMHKLTYPADWTTVTLNDRLGVLSLQCSTANSELLIVPDIKTYKKFRLKYTATSYYGAVGIYINDVFLQTLSMVETVSVGNKISVLITSEVNIESIKLKKSNDAKFVIIHGVYYIDDENDIMLNNYSKNGMKMTELTAAACTLAFSADKVILALGHNDSATPIETFTAKLTELESYVATYGTKVIVLDFIYFVDTPRTLALQNFSEHVNGIYLHPLDENDTNLIEDGSHPTILGHKFFAEEICNALGLSIKSKTFIDKIYAL